MLQKTLFIKDNFLLENKYAEELYYNYASKLPIIDYHCHLSPEYIAKDKVFENLTEAWINGDHYKWRAMRTMGVDEYYITGKASDEEKFMQWAKTVPYTVRNPLYQWTHLELSRYFGIDEILNEKSARSIYNEVSSKLNTSNYSCQNLLSRMNVETVCTTEDPIDKLEHHKALKQGTIKTKMSTAFRPDKAILIDNSGYLDYIEKLGHVVGYAIDTYDKLCDALRNRIQYFNNHGSKLSDHGITHIYAAEFTGAEITQIFKKKIENKLLSPTEALKFKSSLLLFLAETYHEFGWVQQFHLGALRDNNTRMSTLLGPDTGWDSIGDYPQAESLAKFFNILDSKNKLAKTIIYNLNPADNEIMSSMIGNFNDGTVKGKIQYGSSWWFLDQKDGITKQLNALSNMGLISCFIGMLTDSRSFLSYPRHEYFRRILCNLFGDEIKRGELPNDMEWIGKIISDISYYNAKEYFKF